MTSADGPQMNLARHGIDDRRVAGVDALDDARRLADGGDAQRLGDDRDVALARSRPRRRGRAACVRS